MGDLLLALGGPPPAAVPAIAPDFLVERAAGPAALSRFHQLRQRAFVDEQGLFEGSDLDDRDDDAHTVVLVARAPDGEVVGGVRLFPELANRDLAWWRGGRLVCHPRLGERRGEVGRALVRAACAVAEDLGALRFDALVQPAREGFFAGLGWRRVRPVQEAGRPHVLMRWPIARIEELTRRTKGPLGPLLDGLRPGGAGWVGDDAAPVRGTDVLASVDSIVPSMVERDPVWAGWCGMLVTAGDLSAVGADRVGALDALAAPTAAHARLVLDGLRAGAEAFGLPILGGHTQLGAPAALSVTGLGRSTNPIPAGGGQPGDELTLTADLGGAWRPGYTGAQWDSTSEREAAEIHAMLAAVGRARPRAAKDVSMAGIAGTLGMLAEASACAAELRVAEVVRPSAAGLADWLTCFPGFAVLSAADRGAAPLAAGPAQGAPCGRLVPGSGVTLVWPDGERIEVLPGPATGMGAAT